MRHILRTADGRQDLADSQCLSGGISKESLIYHKCSLINNNTGSYIRLLVLNASTDKQETFASKSSQHLRL